MTQQLFMQPTQTQTFAQPECPVYIHCTRQCTEMRSGTNFVQVRMVNCSERVLCDVYLRIETFDRNGGFLYVRNDVILPDCNALPHTVFGEKRLISLGTQEIGSLRISVERVCFADGMLWRRLPSHRLVDTDRWSTCRCGMRHPPQAENCALCLRNFKNTQMMQEIPVPSEPITVPMFERPAPIVRTGTFLRPPVPREKPEKQRRGTFWLVLLLPAVACVLAIVLYACYEGLIR